MTPDQMAEIIGVTPKTINNYEHDRTPVRRPVALAWALATGVAFEWLWTGAGPDSGPNPAVTHEYTQHSRSARPATPRILKAA